VGHEELAPWLQARISGGERALDRCGGGHGRMLHPGSVLDGGS
jgi:hypothetical protein